MPWAGSDRKADSFAGQIKRKANSQSWQIGRIIVKVNPSDYDYIMYVDASGDDGFNFDSGATTCYAAASLLVKQEDIEYNLDILNRIKRTVGGKETDEIKYSRLRRNRRAPEALSILSNLRGIVASQVVFKKEIDATKYKGNKNLSVVCHYMALRALRNAGIPENSRVLIAIDHMKSTEEQPLNIVLESFAGQSLRDACNFSVVFRDSKDTNFRLIQVADLICGIVREHFEQYETNPDMIHFSTKCPPCQTVFEAKRKYTRILCQHGSSRAKHILLSKNLKYIINLFPGIHSPDIIGYFFTEPPIMMKKHFYLACGRKK